MALQTKPDQHTHSLQDDLARCIHCGFCLQACPTYLELGLEADSPRGRIQLIAALDDNRIQPTPSVVAHLDLCLQCRACETACPSGVQYGRIMETARANLMTHETRPKFWRLRAEAMRQVLPHRARLRFAAEALRIYQRSPVRSFIRRTGLLERLPGNLAASEASLPEIPERPFTPPAQAAGLTRTVAMLTGCVMPQMFPRTHHATIRVLNRLGYRVIFPANETCCGALSLHGGDRTFARKLAKRNIDAFLAENVDTIIVNSAGCGSTMKEYGELLADDSAYRERAGRFAGMTRDVLEFVASHDLGDLGQVHRTVTYQDSCHLVHAQQVKTAPRQILRRIPGLDLREMGSPERCCGSAGLYSLTQPTMSRQLLSSKMDDVEATGASCVATANPGCMAQLESGMRERGITGSAPHVIELLDESMRAAGR
jgi:glycolate oxidase iron-sulfur subunit